MNQKVSFTPVFFWMFFRSSTSSVAFLHHLVLNVVSCSLLTSISCPIRWYPVCIVPPFFFGFVGLKKMCFFFRRWISLFFPFSYHYVPPYPSAGSWALTLPALSMLHTVVLRIYYITFARTRIFCCSSLHAFLPLLFFFTYLLLVITLPWKTPFFCVTKFFIKGRIFFVVIPPHTFFFISLLGVTWLHLFPLFFHIKQNQNKSNICYSRIYPLFWW